MVEMGAWVRGAELRIRGYGLGFGMGAGVRVGVRVESGVEGICELEP